MLDSYFCKGEKDGNKIKEILHQISNMDIKESSQEKKE